MDLNALCKQMKRKGILQFLLRWQEQYRWATAKGHQNNFKPKHETIPSEMSFLEFSHNTVSQEKVKADKWNTNPNGFFIH